MYRRIGFNFKWLQNSIIFLRFVYPCGVIYFALLLVFVTIKILFFRRHLIPKPLLIVLLSELFILLSFARRREKVKRLKIYDSWTKWFINNLLFQLLNAWNCFGVYWINQIPIPKHIILSIEICNYWTNMIYAWRSTSTPFNRAKCA